MADQVSYVPRLVGAASGLAIFGAMLLRGLVAGTPSSTILSRALIGLFVGMGLGFVAGWAGVCVLRETAATKRPEPAEPVAEDRNRKAA